MDLSSNMTFIAGLSVATERVTEFIKRIPGLSGILSDNKNDKNKENLRVIAVHLLAVGLATGLCGAFKSLVPSLGEKPGAPVGWTLYFIYGVLASGGSSFWNSALDTFRGVKKNLGQ